MTSMFIPEKLKIGFQNREGTFTGKLAYVIYYDNKGVLRKESSWNSWRDKTIEPIEIENKPTKGFVLNKGVQRNGYWGNGRSVVRVHHPDNFEFEVSVDNLIGILMHGDCCNRELQQECVFAWYGTELILLPTNSIEYQQSIEFTKRQDLKVSAKNLIKGATYQKRKDDSVYVYLGHFEWFKQDYNDYYLTKSSGKKHVFAYKYAHSSDWRFDTVSVGAFSHCVNEEIHPEYASIVDKFQKSTLSSPIVRFEKISAQSALDEFNPESLPLFYEVDGVIRRISSRYYVNGINNNRWFMRSGYGYESSKVNFVAENRQWKVEQIRDNYYYESSRRMDVTFLALQEEFKKLNYETMTNEQAFEIFDKLCVYCVVGVLENGNRVLI